MGEEETEKSPKPREDDTVRVLPSFLPSFLQSSLDLESALAPETPEQTEQETKEGKDGSIVGTGLRFSGFSGLRVLEFFVRVSGRASGLIY